MGMSDIWDGDGGLVLRMRSGQMRALRVSLSVGIAQDDPWLTHANATHRHHEQCHFSGFPFKDGVNKKKGAK